MHIFRPWQKLQKFQTDLAKIVGGVAFTKYPVYICFGRGPAKKMAMSSKCKKVTTINLRITGKPHAHLQTDKTHVKFQKYADEIRVFVHKRGHNL